MIIVHEGLNAGLNKKFNLKKHLNLKNAIKLAVAPHALLRDAKNHKGTFAKPKQLPKPTQPRPHIPVPPPIHQFQSYEDVQDYEGLNAGLNKSKLLKKINLKGAIKGVKNYGPSLLSVIPIVGGAASGIVGKIAQSGVGKLATKVANSKVGTAVKTIAKTDIAKNAFANAKSSIGSVSLPANYTDHTDPQGDVTPVKLANPVDPTAKKNNTMLYVGGAAVLGAVAFFATRKK